MRGIGTYAVYSISDQAGKPIALTLIQGGLSRAAATLIAKRYRQNKEKVAVYTGNRVCSFH